MVQIDAFQNAAEFFEYSPRNNKKSKRVNTTPNFVLTFHDLQNKVIKNCLCEITFGSGGLFCILDYV